MRDEDLLERAKTGDSQAFASWSRIYKATIFRFAFQAGLPIRDFNNFYQRVLQGISTDLDAINDSDAENRWLEAAGRILKQNEQEYNAGGEEGFIRFEEDLLTHQALQKVGTGPRLAVILIQFHNKNLKEAAVIMNESEEITENGIAGAMNAVKRELALESMGEVQKRMDLLDKSYNRIAVPEEDESVIAEIPSIDPVSPVMKQDSKPPVNRWTIAVLAGASLFLSAVIGTSFLFNEQPATPQQTAAEEENPTTVTREMIKKWKAEYDEVRKSAPERLGISSEIFEQLEYVNKSDALMERTFSSQNVKQMRNDPERMRDQVNTLMLNIETPKGMLDAVKGENTLLPSELAGFFVIYTEKTDQLMTIADGLLEQYKEELPAADINDPTTYDRILYSRGNHPEAIENLTASLRELTLTYGVHPNEDRFRTIRDVNPFYGIQPFNSDTQANYYLEYLRTAPYFDDTGMLWPAEQLSYSIMTMADLLIEPSVDPALRSLVEHQLTNVFFGLVTGGWEDEIFDSSGTVKEEYRAIWKSMLQLDNNPLTYVMLPILEEFEESGWKESAHYDELALPTLLDAVEMERSGELAAKLPNGDLKIESALFVVEENYNYSDVQPLYEKFAQGYDMEVLSGVKPMEILKLYYYANKLEDSEMMWHLTVDDALRPPLEEYMMTWKKLPELTEKYRSMEVYGENTQRQGRKVSLLVMGTKTENNHIFFDNEPFILVTERDQVWKMQNNINQFHTINDDLAAYDQNVRDQYYEITQTGDLDSVRFASPAETAGIFLLALEKEDIRTMRLLVNDGENPLGDEEFKIQWMSGQLPVYSEIEGISFRADTYNLDILGISGSIDVIQNIETMEQSHYLPVEKVDGIWKIGNMFGY